MRPSLPQWHTPPVFPLDPAWGVVAGEDSREKLVMADKASKLPAANYPSASHAPPTPAEPAVKVRMCVRVRMCLLIMCSSHTCVI